MTSDNITHDQTKKSIYTKISIKSKLYPNNFYTKKLLIIVSLLFMTALLFSQFISMFSAVSPFALSDKSEVVNSVDELVSAVAAVPKGVTCVVTLGRDIALKGALVIRDGQNITLTSDISTKFYKLSGVDDENTITIENGGELRLNGIIVTHADNAIGRGVEVNFGGTLVMYQGEIFNNNATDGGGGVYNEGTFIMFGGKIFGNTAIIGGGVYNFCGNFSMSGGEIIDNTAKYFGGGVNSSGDFSRLGGVISGNIANGVDNDVDGVIVDAWPDSTDQSYLLFIGGTAVIVVGFVVVILIIIVQRSKKTICP